MRPPPSFEFSDGKLSCTAAPTMEGVAPGTLESDLKIERVVILGLPADKDYAARIVPPGGGKGRRLEAARGSAHPLLPAEQGQAVVVRAVGAPIGKDWVVEVGAEVAEE